MANDSTSVSEHAFDRRVWLLALGTFAIGTDANVISGILPQLAHDLRVGVDAAGQVVTSYSFSYAISAPLLAAITARLRPRRTVVAALLAFIVANALCAVAPTYFFLIGARVLAGVAAGLYSPTAYSLAASLARPDRKGTALAAVAFGLSAATLLGVPLGTLIGQHAGWHGTFWLIVVLSIVAAAALAFRAPRAAVSTGTPVFGLAARLEPLVHRPMLLALLPNLIWCAAIFVTYTYLGAIFAERDFKSGTVIALFFAFGLGGLLGSQTGGHLADRFGASRVIVLFLTVGIVDTLAFGLPGASVWGSAIVTFVLAFTVWMLLPAQQSRLLSIIEPHHAQLVLALNNSAVYLGVAAGAAMGAALIRRGIALSDLHWVSLMFLCLALFVFGLSHWTQTRTTVV
jgi:predicted MFS family arabinose efflux permease